VLFGACCLVRAVWCVLFGACCLVRALWVTGSYFLNGVFFIYDAVRWKRNGTLLADFISVSLFTIFLSHNYFSSILSIFLNTSLPPCIFTTAEGFW
jgi:hypothetical protein